jgi:crotonobetainyl-CoA:carnitine CoA-transferase CaiB-like acyl-CoA transferase
MTDAFDGGLPLAGLSVVEITGIEAVAYAALLLGQLGADVIKIEPPGGDPVRRRPPLLDTPAGGASIAFEFLNAGKTSQVCDDSTMTAVRDQVAAADIVIADHLALRSLRLEIPPRRPGQLHVFAGPYGGSPGAAAPSSPLTRLHAGTSGYLIPADAEPTARPGWPGPYVFEAVHGVGLALAVVAERLRPEGGVVDYSLQAYGLWLEKLLYSRTSVRGIDFHRTTAVYPYGGNIACRDGYVAIFVIEERQWRGFAAMIGRPEWLTDERFADGVLRSTNRAPIAAELAAWCAARTVGEVIAAGARHDVPMGRVRRPRDVLSSEVLLDRGFFHQRRSELGMISVPSLPFGPAAGGRVGWPSPQLSADQPG